MSAILQIFRATGAVAVGVASCADVDPRDMKRLDSWLESGFNAGMDYMCRWRELRANPVGLLEEARSVISLAYPYEPRTTPVAAYALGDDYHDVLRAVLSEAVEKVRAEYGGEWRICVDSAPILERYWAEKAGIGARGRNGLIYVDGYGSRVFLAEVVTTLALSDVEGQPRYGRACPDGCRLCVDACPARALQEDATVDARRCLSYLTIEHKGEWDEIGASAMATPAGRHTLFGCDICQRVCPLNREAKIDPDSILPQLRPREEIVSLTPEEAAGMTQPQFSARFRRSAIKRTRLAGLHRNALNILNK